MTVKVNGADFINEKHWTLHLIHEIKLICLTVQVKSANIQRIYSDKYIQ